MIKNYIAHILLVVLLHIPLLSNTATAIEPLEVVMPFRTERVTPHKYHSRVTEFLQFKILGTTSTHNINDKLVAALETYSGPSIAITSLRRNWNSKSAHNHGKAVDMEWSAALIEWLISDNGKLWLCSNDLMFYIEGKPGSTKLKPYKCKDIYSKYVFENPNATGDHIHIQLNN